MSSRFRSCLSCVVSSQYGRKGRRNERFSITDLSRTCPDSRLLKLSVYFGFRDQGSGFRVESSIFKILRAPDFLRDARGAPQALVRTPDLPCEPCDSLRDKTQNARI
jgi:hypothetical protein